MAKLIPVIQEWSENVCIVTMQCTNCRDAFDSISYSNFNNDFKFCPMCGEKLEEELSGKS